MASIFSRTGLLGSTITEEEPPEPTEEEIQAAKEAAAVLVIQCRARGWRARRSLSVLCQLEDLLLLRPTPGKDAIERLQPTPRKHTEDGLATADCSEQNDEDHWESMKFLNYLPHGPLEALQEIDEENLDDSLDRPRKMMNQTGLSAARAKHLGVTPLKLGQPSGASGQASKRSAPGSTQNSARHPEGSARLPQSATRKNTRGSQDSRTTSKNTGRSNRTSSENGNSARLPVATRNISRQNTAQSLASKSRTSKVSSRSKQSEDGAPLTLNVEGLAYQMRKVPEIKNPDFAAKLIVQLFQVEELLAEHFSLIREHQRLRRRNFLSRVKLRLVMVPHGEARNPPTTVLPGQPIIEEKETVEASSHAAFAAQELTPKGWSEVTRTAWHLRLHTGDYAPSLVLTSTAKCCLETATRLRALSRDDNICDEPEQEPPLGRLRSAGAPAGNTAKGLGHPEAIPCTALDWPLDATTAKTSASLVPVIYSLTEAIGRAVAEARTPEQEAKEAEGAPPPAVLIIAGKAILEVLLACINCQLPVAERNLSRAKGRLGPGDAVFLESPTMFRIVGDKEEEERWRSADELWRGGLRRSKWKVTTHLTGDGRRSWNHVWKKEFVDRTADKPPKAVTAAAWRQYCGDPLIYSQKQFKSLCERAGTVLPLDKLEVDRIRPLIKGFKEKPPPPPPGEEGDGNSSSQANNPMQSMMSLLSLSRRTSNNSSSMNMKNYRGLQTQNSSGSLRATAVAGPGRR